MKNLIGKANGTDYVGLTATALNGMDWDEVILDYEEKLEDMVEDIFAAMEVSPEDTMEGNATITRIRKGEYIALADDGRILHIPSGMLKGEEPEEGTRVMCGLTAARRNVTVCIDSMECVSFGELKYRMFTGIEDGDMTMAATCAWAIYDKAPEPLRENMRRCIHSLRDAVRKHRKTAAA